jgi:hypothetical protein
MKIFISKLDAAKRQLETATQFFFRKGDPVSIHTLTGAAFEILEDICLKRGIKSAHKLLLESIRDDKRDEVSQRLASAKNFFKHADKDPDGIEEFNPELTSIYLWDACSIYFALTKEFVPLFKVLELWFYSTDPELLALAYPQATEVEKMLKKFKLDKNNPSTFLDIIPLIEKIHYNFK